MDIILSALALFVLLIPLLGAWLLVRLTSEGPGLFWTQRVGRGGALFWMPKFRTMKTGAPVKRREDLKDPRQYDTPVGRALRVSSVDELPQLWSVLKGDMSLVGPRPVLPSDRTAIERQIRGCPLKVRPGITGLAQVNGRNRVTPRQKARYDALYVRRHTIWMDIAIKWRTLSVVLKLNNIV